MAIEKYGNDKVADLGVAQELYEQLVAAKKQKEEAENKIAEIKKKLFSIYEDGAKIGKDEKNYVLFYLGEKKIVKPEIVDYLKEKGLWEQYSKVDDAKVKKDANRYEEFQKFIESKPVQYVKIK